jgi:DNA-binding FrmR family transcriptional regulator
MQLSSASRALTQVARLVMTEHLAHCVAEGFSTGDEAAVVEDLTRALEQFAKMK